MYRCYFCLLNVHIYVYIFINMYVCIYIYIYMFISIYIYMYITPALVEYPDSNCHTCASSFAFDMHSAMKYTYAHSM